MSTVPKLTYAKIGKASKPKVESVSSQLLRSKEEKSEDLFSHMNQQNLNYIKKELKLKKNRSDHQRPRSPQLNANVSPQSQGQQIAQRHKLFQKYRGEEQVSQKQQHLEETQRRSQQQKPLAIVLPEDIEEDYTPPFGSNFRQPTQEKQQISNSQNGVYSGKFNEQPINNQNKMYNSLSNNEAKKRVPSLEGYFGEAVSANLNKQDGPQFMEFLEEYISDLNQSKHLKSRQNDDLSIDKKRNQATISQRKRTLSKEDSVKRSKTKVQLQLQQNRKKLEALNRNSDTFGQGRNKFSIESNHSNSSDNKIKFEIQQRLKKEKLNSLLLAKQIEQLRNLLTVKQEIIKSLQIKNQLLRQQVMHIQIKQEIINKSKKNSIDYSSNNAHLNKPSRLVNNQNQILYNPYSSINHNHQRHSSINPNRPTNSYRSFVPPNDQPGSLFQQFAHPKNVQTSKEKGRHSKGSLERLERQYDQFLMDQEQNFKNLRYRKGPKRPRETIL